MTTSKIAYSGLLFCVFFASCNLSQNPADSLMRRYRAELATKTTSADSVALSEVYIHEKADSFPTLPHDSLQVMKDVVNHIWQRENEAPETRLTAKDMGKAEFIGGDAALQTYIKENLRYPVSATEKRIEGTIVVGLVIQPDSTVAAVQLLTSGANEVIAGEANRLALSTHKKWKPAFVKKQPVRSTANMTIVFKLPK